MTEFTPLSAAAGGILIGLAAILLMATTGRIAGVSGFVSRLLPPYGDHDTKSRLAFVLGLLIAPPAYAAIGGLAPQVTVSTSGPLLIVGGLLIGCGAVLGGGCTSGHGICGNARFSPRSFIATLIFMSTAVVTVFVVRHVIGVS